MFKIIIKTLLLPVLIIPLTIEYIDTNLTIVDILGEYYDNE